MLAPCVTPPDVRISRHLPLSLFLFGFLLVPPTGAADFHVDPAGDDTGPGTVERPFATPARAREAARARAGREAVTVHLHAGVYYLPAPLVFEAGDSGSAAHPVVYRAAGDGPVVLSGGVRIAARWEPGPGGVWSTPVPDGLRSDQLFVDGERRILARHPDFDPGQRIFNGFDPAAFGPERAARWADPRGGFIHAMHKHEWGDFHYVITGKSPDGRVTFEGGWQNNRRYGMHDRHRFVENIREELDAPGEWFLEPAAADATPPRPRHPPLSPPARTRPPSRDRRTRPPPAPGGISGHLRTPRSDSSPSAG
jgi:hypothetical protein